MKVKKNIGEISIQLNLTRKKKRKIRENILYFLSFEGILGNLIKIDTQ